MHLVSQIGTANPIAYIIRNTLGGFLCANGNPVYTMTLAAAFSLFNVKTLIRGGRLADKGGVRCERSASSTKLAYQPPSGTRIDELPEKRSDKSA